MVFLTNIPVNVHLKHELLVGLANMDNKKRKRAIEKRIKVLCKALKDDKTQRQFLEELYNVEKSGGKKNGGRPSAESSKEKGCKNNATPQVKAVTKKPTMKCSQEKKDTLTKLPKPKAKTALTAVSNNDNVSTTFKLSVQSPKISKKRRHNDKNIPLKSSLKKVTSGTSPAKLRKVESVKSKADVPDNKRSPAKVPTEVLASEKKSMNKSRKKHKSSDSQRTKEKVVLPNLPAVSSNKQKKSLILEKHPTKVKSASANERFVKPTISLKSSFSTEKSIPQQSTNYKIPKKPTKLEVRKDSRLENSLELGFSEDMEFELTDENIADDSMDWEPISVEEIVNEVNEVRRGLVKEHVSQSLSEMLKPSSKDIGRNLNGSGDFYLAIDTNVYISSLPFVEKLLDSVIPGLGRPTIYVPHRILRELDGLKEARRNPVISENAQLAIKYLNKGLSGKNPSIKGQTMEQYRDMEKNALDEDGSDDKIILSCIQLRKFLPKKSVIILSNDVNLRNKALVDGFESYSVAQFKNYQAVLRDKSDLPKSVDDRARIVLRLTVTIFNVFSKALRIENPRASLPKNALEACQSLLQSLSRSNATPVSIADLNDLTLLCEHLKALMEGNEDVLQDSFDEARSFLNSSFFKSKSCYVDTVEAISILDQLQSALQKLDEPVIEEKFTLGALQTILSDCWQAVEREFDLLKEAVITKNRAAFQPERVDQDLASLQELSNALDAVVQVITPDASSPELPRLAKSLSVCSSADPEQYLNILMTVIGKPGTNELLEKARDEFKLSCDKFITAKIHLELL